MGFKDRIIEEGDTSVLTDAEPITNKDIETSNKFFDTIIKEVR